MRDYADFYDRDYPCMIFNKRFIVGSYHSSHATMIQEMEYGMDFNTNNYEDLYIKSNFDSKNKTLKNGNTKPEGLGIAFYRKDVMDLFEDYDSYCFGEIKGNEVAWDIDYGNRKYYEDWIRKYCKNTNYKHFYRKREGVKKDKEKLIKINMR